MENQTNNKIDNLINQLLDALENDSDSLSATDPAYLERMGLMSEVFIERANEARALHSQNKSRQSRKPKKQEHQD